MFVCFSIASSKHDHFIIFGIKQQQQIAVQESNSKYRRNAFGKSGNGLDPPHRIHVSNTRFTLVMNEAKAHIALHVSEFYILLCIWCSGLYM